VDFIWEQVVVAAHDPGALGRWWAEALGWVVVRDAADEFEIRPTPDWVPGLLFVPIPEEKAGKNRLHLDFSPVDQTAEVERLFPSVLGGPMSGSVARRGWYSPTLKAMSSASSGDGFGPIPWSRRHRTALHSENRTPAVPLTGWLAQRPPSELTTWRRRVEERWKRRRGRRIIRAARPSYRANSSCRASNAAGSTAFHSCRLLAHRSMTR
jgi:hypothetical protein